MIDTHDASACRFLIEGGDDLCLEPPPGADSYLFSGAPVERRSWRAENQAFQSVPQPRLGRRPSAMLEGLRLNELLDKHWAA